MTSTSIKPATWVLTVSLSLFRLFVSSQTADHSLTVDSSQVPFRRWPPHSLAIAWTPLGSDSISHLEIGLATITLNTGSFHNFSRWYFATLLLDAVGIAGKESSSSSASTTASAVELPPAPFGAGSFSISAAFSASESAAQSLMAAAFCFAVIHCQSSEGQMFGGRVDPLYGLGGLISLVV